MGITDARTEKLSALNAIMEQKKSRPRPKADGSTFAYKAPSSTQMQLKSYVPPSQITAPFILGEALKTEQAGDAEGAKQLYELFWSGIGDSSSPIYNPYVSPTSSKAYTALSETGIPVPANGYDKEDLDMLRGYADYSNTGIGGAPLAPSKASTPARNTGGIRTA